MINRKIEPRLLELLRKKSDFNNVILVEGVRQVGKTTLIRDVLSKNKQPYIECNLEEKRALAEKINLCEDFDAFTDLLKIELGFVPGNDAILFIDESQESRNIGSFIRFMKEKWPRTQVILSGSIMSQIFKEGIRYPVGRITHVTLQPFLFEEFISVVFPSLLEKFDAIVSQTISDPIHKKFLDLLDNYFMTGGLPEVVLAFASHNHEWESIRNDILMGYYNDFKRVYGDDRQAYFIASLKASAVLLGSPFKNTYVSALLDGGKNTDIILSLSQLEAWKMILKIDQCGTSPETQFYPKRYLFDLGIAKHIREMALPEMRLAKNINSESYGTLGGLVENFVAINLCAQSLELTGWKKSSSGSEVDFIVKQKGRLIPVECKTATAIKNSHLSGLHDFMDIHQLSLGVVISMAPFELKQLPNNRTILMLPLYFTERLLTIIENLNLL